LPEPFKRPYLDSSVYISAIKGEGAEPGRGDVSAQVLDLARQGNFVVVASTFVVAEVIKDRGRPELTGPEEAAIDGYLEHGFIQWVEVDLLIARKARDLSRQHKLKPGDAVHLATAIRGGCDQLLAWDGGFPNGMEIEGVTCNEPHLVGLPQPLEGFPDER